MNRHEQLIAFVTESNAIESIHRPPTQAELDATYELIFDTTCTIESVKAFVAVCQPGARLRSQPGLNVRVGNYYPPPGGPFIESDLKALLRLLEADAISPLDLYLRYEALHPFTDGNGRSGRALWLRAMNGDASLTFLKRFHYQVLERWSK